MDKIIRPTVRNWQTVRRKVLTKEYLVGELRGFHYEDDASPVRPMTPLYLHCDPKDNTTYKINRISLSFERENSERLSLSFADAQYIEYAYKGGATDNNAFFPSTFGQILLGHTYVFLLDDLGAVEDIVWWCNRKTWVK